MLKYRCAKCGQKISGLSYSIPDVKGAVCERCYDSNFYKHIAMQTSVAMSKVFIGGLYNGKRN